jgi:hypothetical protein
MFYPRTIQPRPVPNDFHPFWPFKKHLVTWQHHESWGAPVDVKTEEPSRWSYQWDKCQSLCWLCKKQREFFCFSLFSLISTSKGCNKYNTPSDIT